jgi:ABC-type amino acid transport substrate-binding protein
MIRQKQSMSFFATVVVAVVVSIAVVYFMPPRGAVMVPAKQKESVYDRVMRTGTIRCGYGVSPPVLVQNPNTKEISGLDYDIWQEIGKELDLKVEFVEEAGWGNFIEGLRGSRYDAFCSELWPDPARTKYLTLTAPVIYSFLLTYVRVDDRRFDGHFDRINAVDVTIPAIEGDVSVAISKDRFPRAKIYALPQTATISDMMMAVQSKKADVIFLDQGMIALFEAQNPGVLREVKNVPPAFVFGSRFGVNIGEIEFRDMIDVALRKIIDDGRMEKMARQYSDDYIIPARNYDAP